MSPNPLDDFVEAEFAEGYFDGRQTDTPEAGANRSPAYRHSFTVGRAEREGKPIPAHISRGAAETAERETRGEP